MTPDLAGRLQTRLLVFLLAVLPGVAALAAAFDLGGRPGAAALFVVYWLPLALAAEPLYALAQALRREGDWPMLHVVYGLVLEGLAGFSLMRADLLPGVPACLKTAPDLAMRRTICAVPSLSEAEAVAVIAIAIVATLVMLGLILPIVLPRWSRAGWRLRPRGDRR